MTVESHLVWPALPTVALKLWAARDLQGCGRPLSKALGTTAVQNLFGHANISGPHRKNARWAPAPLAGEVAAPLEAYFSRVARAYEADSKAAGEDVSDVSLAPGSLLNACQRRLCESCAERAGRLPCAWQASSEGQDLENLRSEPMCLSPLRAIYDFCRLISEQAYRDLAGVRPVNDVCIHFQTSRARSKNDQTGLAVGGSVGDLQAGHRYVRLSFEPEEFGLGDYLSLPYVLVHEFVAHGHCGVALKGTGYGDSRSFHDGWMDRVALKVLQWFIVASNDGSVVPRYPTEFLERALSAHGTRRDSFAKNSTDEAEQYADGFRAMTIFAELTATALAAASDGTHEYSEGEVDRVVLIASLRLNASLADHMDRRDLVMALLANFDLMDEKLRREAYLGPRGVRALGVVAQYFGDLDVVAMTRALVKVLSHE